ncbi:HAMP domain-containing methyl-accepting chemotaxis protein [Vibrio sp. MEBiC08052]|uniref:HAMP domain-containing methyl-accepting chemotaxis protein n=1 Tax=Vibrio sp. MEBiC08052 TaxID=1761910 RepID=UPI00074062DB|nr:HAMP domain-containing methyl-accepting chemotaxis protein [Vibrio sp. MEBiC08052]KUI97503.1 methyl-accepting chemotaxis sensory transducer [Vibrio sp. MEBiC08052]
MKKFLENRLIGTKLALGFGSVLLLALVVGIFGITGVSTLHVRAEKVRLSNDLDDTVVDMRINLEHYVISGSEEDNKQVQHDISQLQGYLQTAEQLYSGVNVRNLTQQTQNNLADYQKTLTKLIAARTRWDGIDRNAVQYLQSIYTQYGQIIAQLRQHNDPQALTAALDVSNDWYALTTEMNKYISKKQDIPIELVTTRFQSVVNKTAALQLPNALNDTRQSILSLLGKYEDLGKINPEINKNLADAQNRLIELSAQMDKQIDAITTIQEQNSIEDGRKVSMLSIAATAIAILIGIFFSLFIRHLIVQPMNEVIKAVGNIANGDLTQNLSTDRKDELGQLYNHIGEMSKTLNKLISEVVSGVMNLSTTSEQLESISNQSQHMMQSQRDETDQVATAINEMSATVSEVARNAETAAEATTKTDNIIIQGNHIVNATAKTIDALASDIVSTSEAMEQLKLRTDNVGNVLEVIKTVAEQTNLLALNAAIEAARAGEAGRGFAVVADEVRGLASRTQSSAKEIEDLIVELQNGAQSSLDKMIGSRELSGKNAEQAKEVLTLFENISEQVRDVQDMNNQIATAAEEQSQVSEDINRSVENVRELADKTAEGSLESVNAVANLRQLSQQLKKLTDQFLI